MPQMQKSWACYERRGLSFAQQQGLPQLGAGRDNLDLLGHGASREQDAQNSPPTAMGTIMARLQQSWDG